MEITVSLIAEQDTVFDLKFPGEMVEVTFTRGGSLAPSRCGRNYRTVGLKNGEQIEVVDQVSVIALDTMIRHPASGESNEVFAAKRALVPHGIAGGSTRHSDTDCADSRRRNFQRLFPGARWMS